MCYNHLYKQPESSLHSVTYIRNISSYLYFTKVFAMQARSHTLFIALIIIVSGFITKVSAQERPGKKDSITSAILNQKRFIQVVLPPDYKPGSADKYDVIYVTDGDDNTKTIADIQYFIGREGFMPKVIIVGILNIDR